jgi:tripartite-type tricarboxylate transporter receptor subunit TctC
MKTFRIVVALALLGSALAVRAQGYPSHSISLVVPFSAGGPTDTINGAIVETLADPAVRKRLADLGQEIPPREQLSPAALGAHHRAEIEKWWPVIKTAGIKAD